MIKDGDINYGYDHDSVLEILALAYTENLAISPNFYRYGQGNRISLMNSVRRFRNWMGDKPEYPHRRVP